MSSVDAWYFTQLTWKKSSATLAKRFPIFGADVVKSSDTVDRDIFNCILDFVMCTSLCTGKFGYVFKLATGPGVAWTRDGRHPSGMLPQHSLYRRTSCALIDADWKILRVFDLSFTQITLSVTLVMSIPCWLWPNTRSHALRQ